MQKLYIYSACGNIIGLITQPYNHTLIQQYLKSVDQLLILNNNTVTIYNQDGSLAKQCGNGLRALAYHLGPYNHMFAIDGKIYHTYYKDDQHWVAFPLPTHSAQAYGHIPYALVNVGNLHAIFDQKYHQQHHLLSPLMKNYNISYIETKDDIIDIMTYERGVGYTESCGSAACAAAYISNLGDEKTWKVKSKGGTLTTSVSDVILQTGPITQLEQINI